MKTIPLLLTVLLLYSSVSAQEYIPQLRALNELINTPFSSLALKQQRDEKLLHLQNPIKDEFETQAMFDKRRADAANKAKEIRQECELRIADANRKHDERIGELKGEREQLLAGAERDAVSSFALGSYDAEKQKFPVTLKVTNQSYDISVPLQLAREFKNASASLQAKGKQRLTENESYDYFNWQITFSGELFTFGPQKGKQRSSIAAQPPQGAPPDLKASVKFNDPSGNGKLDANESGEIVVTIANKGKGTAFGTEVKAKLEGGSDITVTPSVYLGEILPGQSRSTTVSLRAGNSVAEGTVTCLLTYDESNGFAPAGNRIILETKALVPPKLILADVGVDDFNKNGKIEPGEIVTVTARIQNTGRGEARTVKARIAIRENVFLAGGSQSEFDIGTLESGKFADVTFSIYTNLQATSVPLSITVTESYGRYGITQQQLPLSFNKQMASIEEITVRGKEEKQGDIKIAKGLSVDVDQNIPQTNAKNADAVAVVIGISKYKNSDVPGVDYAKHGATIMKEYLISVLGYDEKRIIYAEDENAGLADFKKMFQKLSNMVRAGKSDVFVYYNGHGSPDTKSNEAFFVPYDCDPTYASQTGYAVSEFYNQLTNLPAKSTTIVLDACFSGSSPKGLLFKGVSSALLKVKNPIMVIPNGIVFSSSSENQISNWYSEKKHGLFTYYFLKALQGDADANKDKQLTVQEIEQYLLRNIPDKAREQNREQTPQVIGDKSRVLVKY
ncbi:MAG: caspase family protein [Ignavibacteria bacterium]|nr:caspase family protein [Ignavibacteria bacterium]